MSSHPGIGAIFQLCLLKATTKLTLPTYHTESRNRTQATLVEGLQAFSVILFHSLACEQALSGCGHDRGKDGERAQGCALAAPGGLRLLTFVFGRLEKLIFAKRLRAGQPRIHGWGPLGTL